MPAVGFMVAVLGSALYGFLFGVGGLAIYALRGAPGLTGMEILGVPYFMAIATIDGAIAAVISLLVPRTSLRFSDSFVLLAAASCVVQALVSLPPYLLADGLQRHDPFMHVLAMSGPVDWRTNNINLGWVYMLPLILLLCSSWFRWRFEG